MAPYSNLQLSCILKTPVKEVSLHATHKLTNKQTQQSSLFFGSHYKTTSFVRNGRIPVLRVSDIGGISKLEGASWSDKGALYDASKKISSKWKFLLEI